MATKKTSAPKKTTTAKSTETKPPEPKAAASNASASRPTAECPFPEHLRVDLESAQAEVLKGLVAADAPLPVFSTRALEHGKKASGAEGLRNGFSWNAQMDLAWALGYPMMTFVIDGAFEADSKEAILAFYGRTLSDLESDSWFECTQTAYRGLVPRRAAFALLYEVEHGKHPFGLAEKKFLQATEPRELSRADLWAIVEKLDDPSLVERTALLLEALAGSSLVVDVLCDLHQAHPPAEDEECSDFQIEVLNVLRAMLRRVPAAEVPALRKRGAPDPRADGMHSIAQGWLDSALTDLQWVDGVEEDVLRAFLAESKEGVGDVPFPRYLFAGGEKLIEQQVGLFDRYMDGPRVFFSQYSTVRHPLMTGPALLTRAKRDYRDGMTLWFGRHADFFRPLLVNLSKDPKLGKHASDVLKTLG